MSHNSLAPFKPRLPYTRAKDEGRTEFVSKGKLQLQSNR